MSQTQWAELLDWGEPEIEDLRLAGYSYIKQGQYLVALKFFRTLVLISKNNAYDLQVLGALLLQVGDNLEALNYLEQALKIDATHEFTLLNRAKALFLLGYKRQALIQAAGLEKSSNSHIADQARALTLAYS
ncbi:MAG: type III secretion chaperone [Chlamydiota bacterium]